MNIMETAADVAETMKQANELQALTGVPLGEILDMLTQGYTLTPPETTQESLGKPNEEKDEESIPAYPWEYLNIAYPEDYIDGAIESVCKGICNDFYVEQNSKRAETVFLLVLSYVIVKNPDNNKNTFDMSAVTSLLESLKKGES